MARLLEGDNVAQPRGPLLQLPRPLTCSSPEPCTPPPAPMGPPPLHGAPRGLG